MDAIDAERVALSVEAVDLAFGGVVVLRDVGFDVHEGEILALIGPNGAGKSSLFNVITGVYKPDQGSVRFRVDRELDLLRIPAHRLAGLGVARTFQSPQLMPDRSVLENVMVGRHPLMRTGTLRALVWLGAARSEDRKHRQISLDTLDFLELGNYAMDLAGSLPYGIQKRVEIARALATQPKLLLLDEPAAGLNNEETEEISWLMGLIRSTGTCTQVLVEHDMSMVMSTADRIVVLDHGSVIALGSVDEIRDHPQVAAAYFGSAPG